MAKNFKLSIITPERLFFEGEVEMLVVESTDGQLAIMAGHEQGVIAIESGEIRIKQNGEYKDAAISSGMVTVAHDETLVMVQTVEWPEEIDIRPGPRTTVCALRKCSGKRIACASIIWPGPVWLAPWPACG